MREEKATHWLIDLLRDHFAGITTDYALKIIDLPLKLPERIGKICEME